MHGFEPILEDELKALGVQETLSLTRAVRGTASLETIYKINYQSYFALRVLVNIREDKVHNIDQLYRSVQRINWTEMFSTDTSFAVHCSIAKSDTFTHSHYVSLKTKDAIVDQFNDAFGERPDVDTEAPNIVIHIHIFKNNLSIAFDSTGKSLHKRGYKLNNVTAPINEVLAAGLFKLSNWDGKKTIWDPMCGSGTFIAEALLQVFQIPPQNHHRAFCFKFWKNFDQELWKKVVQEAQAKTTYIDDFKIKASDKDSKAINATKYNIAELGLLSYVDIDRSNFFETEQADIQYHIMMNPPYDERLKEEAIIAFYQLIGDTLKTSLKGSEAWIISAHIPALKRLGLRPSKKYTLFNGPLESRFHKFEMYAGSKKSKYKNI